MPKRCLLILSFLLGLKDRDTVTAQAVTDYQSNFPGFFCLMIFHPSTAARSM